MGLIHLLRRLRRSPMFAFVTLLTLAIGIGANTAIFSVLDGVLLKPLPYPHAEQLIAVDHKAPGVHFEHAGSAPFLYYTYREQNRTLQDVGLWSSDSAAITGSAEPQRVEGVDVTQGVLPILGVQPIIGRLFSQADDSPGTQETVILSYGYWRSHYGGDSSAVGRTIMADDRPRLIIGVTPESFHFLDQNPALIFPMRIDRSKIYLGNFSFHSLARLKPGVSLAQASADEARLIPVALDSFPPYPGYSKEMFQQVGLAPNFAPLKDSVVGDIASTLWILMATIGIVLVIACANVANLLLVRTEGRQQELAIRAALGAGSGRIARDLFMESLLLGLAGGAFGVALAYGGIRWLISMAPANLPRLSQITIDAPVLLFALAASLLAGLLFGAIPVLKYAGPRVASTLRAGGRSLSQSRERHRARSTLVVVQVALAMLLLIGSGLMIRTFRTLRHVTPGFTNPDQVLTMNFYIPDNQVKDPVQSVRMEQEIMDKVAALPGVDSVALSSYVPTDTSGWHDPIYAEDRSYADQKIPPLRRYRMISPGLLKTMGQSLVAGRDFTWTDVYDMRPVCLVSENLARELWGSPAAAIGKRIHESLKGEFRQVVGVVSDERDDGVNQPAPTVAFWPLLMDDFAGNKPFVQRGGPMMIRSSRAGSSGFVQEVSRAVWSINPNLPLAYVRTMREVYDKSLARTSFTLTMLALAGAMALLLGLIGIYGVISYSVSQRTREIGIRMALGSPQTEVTRIFLWHGLRLAAVGVACGLVAAAATTRLMSSLLFHVSPLDPLTYAGVAGCLVAAAALASFLPALRATAVDPVEALRAE
ncbi:MAG TPA: ABC transporter permease [Bryobacteraceae bacterium]|nr:ABC transporter permease [Bryobacteraceae bacterium]